MLYFEIFHSLSKFSKKKDPLKNMVLGNFLLLSLNIVYKLQIEHTNASCDAYRIG